MTHNSRVVAGVAATALLVATACGSSVSTEGPATAISVQTADPGSAAASSVPAETDSKPRPTADLRTEIAEVVDTYHTEFWPAFMADMDVERELLDEYLSGPVLNQVRGHYVHYTRGEGTLAYTLESVIELSDRRAVVQVCQFENVDYYNSSGLHSPAKQVPIRREMTLLRSPDDGRWRLDLLTHVPDPDDGRFWAECLL